MAFIRRECDEAETLCALPQTPVDSHLCIVTLTCCFFFFFLVEGKSTFVHFW